MVVADGLAQSKTKALDAFSHFTYHFTHGRILLTDFVFSVVDDAVLIQQATMHTQKLALLHQQPRNDAGTSPALSTHSRAASAFTQRRRLGPIS